MYHKQNNFGFSHLIILIAIAVLGLVGLAGWRVLSANKKPKTNQSSVTSEIQDPLSQQNLSNIKSFEEINQIAQNPEKNIVNIKLENEDGKLIYVIYYDDGSLGAYDAYSGASTGLANAGTNSDNKMLLPKDLKMNISLQEAIRIAQNSRPNSKIKKVELDLENNILLYSIRFTDDSRVDVSSVDGIIVRQKDTNSTSGAEVEDGDDSHEGEETHSSSSGTSSNNNSDDSSYDSSDSSNDSTDDSDHNSTDDDEADDSEDRSSDDRSGSNSGRN